MEEEAFLLISVVVNLVLMAALILSEHGKGENRRKLKNLNRYLDDLERAFRDDGGQTCCTCGKPYRALNDPDYSPELHICRDCMWKMFYGQAFGDDQTATDGSPFAFKADRDILESTLGSYRRETYG